MYVHKGCTSLTATRIHVFTVQLESRKLKILCLDCENGLAELPSLKSLINSKKNETHKMLCVLCVTNHGL